MGALEAKARPRTWPYTCGIKETEATHVLVRRGSVNPEEVEAFIREVEGELTRAGRSRQGPTWLVWKGPDPTNLEAPKPVDVAVMTPVQPGSSPPVGFELQSVPSQQVAYTIHHGTPEAVKAAETVLCDWVRMKSLAFGNEIRRIYLKRGKNPRKDITEVQIPLRR